MAQDSVSLWVESLQVKAFASTPLMAELKAIQEEIIWILRKGWPNIIIKTDCKKTVETLEDSNSLTDANSQIINVCRAHISCQPSLI